MARHDRIVVRFISMQSALNIVQVTRSFPTPVLNKALYDKGGQWLVASP